MNARSAIKSALRSLAGARVLHRLKPARDIFERTVVQDTLAKQIVQLADDRGYDDVDRHEMLYAIARKLTPDFAINDHGRIFLDDDEFRNWFERFAENNYKNYERRWTLKELLRLLPAVPGDLAECGVYQGATASRLCQFATEHGRRVHLFDSFEGLSKPGESDGSFWTVGDLSVSEAVVRNNLAGFDCFDTFPGWIPTRFGEVADRRYAFLHVDVDLEQPTYDSIAFFYPRMSAGGVIVLDDHGYYTCPGARKAALDYMADKPEPVIDLATGQGIIIKR